MSQTKYSNPNQEIPEILNSDYDIIGALKVYLWTQNRDEFRIEDVNIVIETIINDEINNDEPLSNVILQIFQNRDTSKDAAQLITQVWESSGLITKGRNFYWVFDE